MESTEELQKQHYIKMTEKPVGKLLFGLSVPTILSMMVTNIYNLVDTAFVGTLGTSESGATGIVFGYMSILQAVAFMCGQGAGSNMSRKLGAKDTAKATEFSSSGFFLSFFLGLVIASFTFFFMEPILKLLGSTDTIAPYAGTYIFWILISAPFFTSSYTMNNLLRYEGKSKLGTIALMTGAVLNIGFDAFFMKILNLGITGAGMATAISQTVSFCILLSMFLRRKTQTRISIRYVSRSIKTFWEIAATGFPSLLRQGLNSISTMILNNNAALYGDQAVAAMSIVSRVAFFSMSVTLGIGQGFQPICAFNYGAGKFKRVKKAYWTAFGCGELMVMLISIPLFIFAPEIVQRLRDDIQVIEIGTRALRIVSIGILFVPFSMMTEMGLQSTGAKLLASFSSSLRSGVIFIPAILLLSHFRGLAGIQEASPLCDFVTLMITIFLSRKFLNKLKE